LQKPDFGVCLSSHMDIRYEGNTAVDMRHGGTTAAGFRVLSASASSFHPRVGEENTGGVASSSGLRERPTGRGGRGWKKKQDQVSQGSFPSHASESMVSTQLAPTSMDVPSASRNASSRPRTKALDQNSETGRMSRGKVCKMPNHKHNGPRPHSLEEAPGMAVQFRILGGRGSLYK
jgi:hypothetical protein